MQHALPKQTYVLCFKSSQNFSEVAIKFRPIFDIEILSLSTLLLPLSKQESAQKFFYDRQHNIKMVATKCNQFFKINLTLKTDFKDLEGL